MAHNTTSRGVLPGYETTFITCPELSDDALKALHDKVTEVIGLHSGSVVLTEDWGRRKLAYPIQKESRGRYSHFVYSGDNNLVAELERHLRIHEHVLRFLTVQLASEFNADAFMKRRGELQEAAKRREQERREEREFRGDRDYRGDRGDREPRGERPAGGPRKLREAAEGSVDDIIEE